MTTPDHFTQRFDAIEIDPARAPLPAAFDSALAACATDRPGFHLDDDAGGRFVVDREFGVISLRDEALLATERGRVHDVRLRVVESTGDSYVLDLKLRVTGVVPQMVGAEDLGFGEEHASAVRPAAAAEIAPWPAFSPARGRQSLQPLPTEGAFGKLLVTPLPPTGERVVIAFNESVPAPSRADARWSL